MMRTAARTAARTAGMAAAVLVAVAAATGTAAAGTATPGTGTGTCPLTGTSMTMPAGDRLGNGAGNGLGNGLGRGPGNGGQSSGLLAVGAGTLTSTQRATLASMAEEEKLAHDVYVTLGGTFSDLPQFDRIARAESQHLTTMRALLDRYGIADPTSGRAVGDFADSELRALYTSLVERADTPADALGVGVTIERLDIADLDDAMSGLTAPDVLNAYTHLRQGSQRHLAAFGG